MLAKLKRPLLKAFNRVMLRRLADPSDALRFNQQFADLGSGAVTVAPTAGSGSATFTRAGATATTILSTGLVSAAILADVARSLYDPTSLAYQGYLLEEARTNLCPASAGFDTADWAKAETTVNDGAAVGPDGTTVADGIVASVNSASHVVQSQNFTITAADRVQVTLWGKAGSETSFDLYLVNAGGSQYTGRKFNVSAGTSSAADLPTTGYTLNAYSMVTYPGGWFRCMLDVTTITDTSVNVQVFVRGFTPWVGDGATNAVFLWGAQAEVGAFPTTLIPTAAAAVARAKDLLSYLVSGNVPTNNAIISMSWRPLVASSGTVYLWGSYVDADNYTQILHDGTNLILRKRIAGVNADATRALAYVAGTSYNIEAEYSSVSGMVVRINGVPGLRNANKTACQLGTTFEVGADGNGVVAGAACFSRLDVRGI